MKTQTANNIIAIFIALVAFAAITLILLWIVQTAFGYFGFEFTLWQVFVITLASTILFKTLIKVP